MLGFSGRCLYDLCLWRGRILARTATAGDTFSTSCRKTSPLGGSATACQ